MLHLSQAVLPGMRARGAGTIVNIGSIGGRFVTPARALTTSASTASRPSRCALRAEVGQFGVRVVLIEPTGVRDTKFVEAGSGATADAGRSTPMTIRTPSSSAVTTRPPAALAEMPS